MTDLIERLRYAAENITASGMHKQLQSTVANVFVEAADEIERLRMELEEAKQDAKDFHGQLNRLVEHNNNLCSHRDDLQDQLATKDAVIEKLRYALDHYQHGGSEYGKIAREALATFIAEDLRRSP